MTKRSAPLSNIKAEQALLGALIRSQHSWFAVSHVTPDMMTLPIHKEILSVIADVLNGGRQLSFAVLQSRLPEEDESGQSVTALLHVLAHSAEGLSAEDFADQVAECAKRRQAIAIGESIIKAAKSGDATVIDIASQADNALRDLLGAVGHEDVASIGELAERSIEQTSKAYQGSDDASGFAIGVAAIDELLGPMFPGDVVTVIGESGHGKSALAVQFLMRAAVHSLNGSAFRPSLFVSGEMESLAVARRILATQTGISTRAQRAGDVTPVEFESLRDAAIKLRDIMMYIDGTGRQSMAQLSAKLRAMKRKYNIGSAAIDHLRLLLPSNPKWSEIDTIANAAMEIKDLAKELDIVMIPLVQPKQDAFKRETWRVRSHDIYGGDIVRQCSDALLSIALPEKWLRQREPDSSDHKAHDRWVQQCQDWNGRAEAGVLKARDGEDSLWRPLSFDGQRVMFGDVR